MGIFVGKNAGNQFPREGDVLNFFRILKIETFDICISLLSQQSAMMMCDYLVGSLNDA